MNIAILYRRPDEAGKDYPLDSEGRGGLAHINRIKEVLESLRHKVELVDVNLDMFEHLRNANFDLAFNLCDDGFRNNSLLEAHVPAMLDILGVNYTGAGFFTLAACLDKAYTKKILSFHGIPTPEFQVFSSSNERVKESLRFPLIVKPVHEDASIGIKKESVVINLSELKQRIDYVISNYSQAALVETFIGGREMYVGVLGSSGNPQTLPISEVSFADGLNQRDKICSYEGKWVEDSLQYQATPVKCPAELDKTLEQKLIEIAKECYSLLGCEDYGRVDFRIDKKNRLYVLEINPNPDISEDAGLARMVRAQGMKYEDLIERILISAIAKNVNKEGRCLGLL